LKLLQNKELLAIVGVDGKSFRPLVLEKGKVASNVFEKRIGHKLYVAVFNYGEHTKSLKISDLSLGIKKPKSGNMTMGASNTKFYFSDGQINVLVPAKDAAIICLNL